MIGILSRDIIADSCKIAKFSSVWFLNNNHIIVNRHTKELV